MMEHLCWTAELQLREGGTSRLPLRIFSCHEGKSKMSGISEHFMGQRPKHVKHDAEMLEKETL